MSLFRLSTALVAAGIVTGSANAAIIASQSFESAASDNYGFSTSIPMYQDAGHAWTVTDEPVWSTFTTAYDGSYYFGARNVGSTPLTLTFDTLDLSSYTDVVVSFAYYGIGFESNDYIDADVNGSVGRLYTGLATGTYSMDGWATASYTIADSAGTLDLSLVFRILGSSDAVAIDNIVVTGTLVPAPATAALIALGGLVSARRRRA